MKVSSYLYNLFMTIVILLFLFIAYLFYKVNKVYKETFQNDNNIIDLSGAINIPDFNTRVNISEAINNLETSDLSGSTAYGRDLLVNNESQCEIFQKQIDTQKSRIETYRLTGDFTNLRSSYETIQVIKEHMNSAGCG